MTATAFSGLVISGYGNLAGATSAFTGAPSADPNPDAGPGFEYQGDGILDPRFIFTKDKLNGFTGTIPGQFNSPSLLGVQMIPSAFGAAKLSSVASFTTGTPLALAAGSLGVDVNIPIRPFGTAAQSALNGNAVVTTGLALDFGFDFCTTTTGGTAQTVTVTASSIYTPGMPLCIAQVGNSAGTLPLLCIVTAVPSATTITISAPALKAVTGAAVGTGDLWGPSPTGFPTPTAAAPFVAAGPGFWLDPRQALGRGISITGVSGGASGSVTILGYDVYGQKMSEQVTVAGGATVAYSKKAFKYIVSITPNMTDASHALTVGTSDIFGFNHRCPIFENSDVFWAGTFMSTSTGFLKPDDTAPSATTGDVRGTIQVSAQGGGTGIGTNNSSGALTGIVMGGRAFSCAVFPPVWQAILATQASPFALYGGQQF